MAKYIQTDKHRFNEPNAMSLFTCRCNYTIDVVMDEPHHTFLKDKEQDDTFEFRSRQSKCEYKVKAKTKGNKRQKTNERQKRDTKTTTQDKIRQQD
jgi:hypothetical protein